MENIDWKKYTLIKYFSKKIKTKCNKFTNVHKLMFYSKSWWAISVYYAVKRFLKTLSGWVLFFEVFVIIYLSLQQQIIELVELILSLSHGYTICEIIKHVCYANLIEN